MFTLPTGHYGWSDKAFARRAMGLLDLRSLGSVAAAIAALSGMPFTAGGWTSIKKVIAEIIIGSIAFPADLSSDGSSLAPGVTEDILGTRDVSSTVT
jgi:hypothetical protein